MKVPEKHSRLNSRDLLLTAFEEAVIPGYTLHGLNEVVNYPNKRSRNAVFSYNLQL